jgi:hypothetical protein
MKWYIVGWLSLLGLAVLATMAAHFASAPLLGEVVPDSVASTLRGGCQKYVNENCTAKAGCPVSSVYFYKEGKGDPLTPYGNAYCGAQLGNACAGYSANQSACAGG